MHCKAKAHIFFSLNSVFLFTWQAILSRKLTTASQYCLSIGRSDSVLPVVPVTEPAAPVDPCLARLGSCGESTDAVLLIPAPPLLSTICIVHKDFAFRHSNFFSWILKRFRRKYTDIVGISRRNQLQIHTKCIFACQRGGVSNKPLGQRQDIGPGILWSVHRWTKKFKRNYPHTWFALFTMTGWAWHVTVYTCTLWRGEFHTYWRHTSWIIDITLWRAHVVTSGGWSCSSLIRWTSHFITTSAKSTANFLCSMVAWENKWGKLQLTG